MEQIKKEGQESGTQEHILTPQVHLHLSHTRPFPQRLKEISKLFQTHPLLSQKTARINSLSADRPIENKEHVAHLAHSLLNHEMPMWKNVKINAKYLEPHTPKQKELTDAQKQQIASHASAVKEITTNANAFVQLQEYALISNQSSYEGANHDYQRFMAMAGSAQQLTAMHEMLEQQHLMLRKLDARLSLDAHRVAPLIEDIKLSLADQQVIAARLPEFTFK